MPCISSKAPYISSKEHHRLTVCISTKEPYISSKETYVSHCQS